ncbi:hypothetical protein J4449_00090 [Candidatus Woesearchaeota archaeon]|nr:hypothetical protein [Candidatus Woesearchaeota archaeon]
MVVKLEAMFCSGMLRIFEINGTKNYLGFVKIDAEFTEEEMKYVAAIVYSRAVRDLKKTPKIEVELSYQSK